VYTNGGRTAGRRHILCGTSRWIAISQIARELLPHISRLFHVSMCLRKFVKWVTSRVPVSKSYIEQMFVSVRMQFHNHADTQHSQWNVSEGLYNIYKISNWNTASAQQWYFTAQMLWWFCGFAYLKGNTGHQDLRDLITTAVNLNRKLGYLSSQVKIIIF